MFNVPEKQWAEIVQQFQSAEAAYRPSCQLTLFPDLFGGPVIGRVQEAGHLERLAERESDVPDHPWAGVSGKAQARLRRALAGR